MLKSKIEQDLKTALLAGDTFVVEVLRGLKSVILYAEVAAGKRDDGLQDDEVIELLQKEAKKRQESADLYVKGGSQDRADRELKEKEIIESYLPEQLSQDMLERLVADAAKEAGGLTQQTMGKVISIVKQKAGGAADGARIAQAVKQKLG